MNKMSKLMGMALLVVLVANMSWALTLGDNITVYDGMGSWQRYEWYPTHEDQEVEPGNAYYQFFDLEGFFLDGSTLSMVGGYNFRDGVWGYDSGDIFFDVDGDHGSSASARRGYDYVMDLDMVSESYSVYELTDSSVMQNVQVSRNADANPWRYVNDGSASAIFSGAISLWDNLSDAEVGGLQGGYHNVVGVDISWLGNQDFVSHFTMGCGNDNLMGKGSYSVPDGGTTLLLLGMALLGFAGLRKKLLK